MIKKSAWTGMTRRRQLLFQSPINRKSTLNIHPAVPRVKGSFSETAKGKSKIFLPFDKVLSRQLDAAQLLEDELTGLNRFAAGWIRRQLEKDLPKEGE